MSEYKFSHGTCHSYLPLRTQLTSKEKNHLGKKPVTTGKVFRKDIKQRGEKNQPKKPTCERETQN